MCQQYEKTNCKRYKTITVANYIFPADLGIYRATQLVPPNGESLFTAKLPASRIQEAKMKAKERLGSLSLSLQSTLPALDNKVTALELSTAVPSSHALVTPHRQSVTSHTGHSPPPVCHLTHWSLPTASLSPHALVSNCLVITACSRFLDAEISRFIHRWRRVHQEYDDPD